MTRPSVGELRHYGYIICGAEVEVWEMYVTRSIPTQEKNRRETCYTHACFHFPAQMLSILTLTTAVGVKHFCDWHAKIMNWGLEVCSLQYFEEVDYPLESKIPSDEWILTYEDAMGRDIPSLPEEEQEDTNPIHTWTAADSPNYLIENTGAAGLSV